MTRGERALFARAASYELKISLARAAYQTAAWFFGVGT